MVYIGRWPTTYISVRFALGNYVLTSIIYVHTPAGATTLESAHDQARGRENSDDVKPSAIFWWHHESQQILGTAEKRLLRGSGCAL
jgi:hypothetical protein